MHLSRCLTWKRKKDCNSHKAELNTYIVKCKNNRKDFNFSICYSSTCRFYQRQILISATVKGLICVRLIKWEVNSYKSVLTLSVFRCNSHHSSYLYQIRSKCCNANEVAYVTFPIILSFLCILIKMVLCNAHIEAWVLSYQNYLYFRKVYDIWYVGLTNILFTKTSSMCIYVVCCVIF